MPTRPPDVFDTLLPMPERTVALERLGNEIAELSAHLEAATARLLALIREFDERGGWMPGSAPARLGCPGAWGSPGRGTGARPGRACPRSAARLAEALGRGEISCAKVRAITRVATPETEAWRLAVGRAGTAHHVERVVQGWCRWAGWAKGRKSRSSTPGAGCTCTRTRAAW